MSCAHSSATRAAAAMPHLTEATPHIAETLAYAAAALVHVQ
jgi:hypothetical protein